MKLLKDEFRLEEVIKIELVLERFEPLDEADLDSVAEALEGETILSLSQACALCEEIANHESITAQRLVEILPCV